MGARRIISIGLGVGILVSLLLYLNTCAPPPKKEISPERLKAIQDSLRKVYEFELAKAWSTGYEYHKNKLYRRALPHLWKAAEMDTALKFKRVYILIADCYIKLNMVDSAQYAYERGIEKFPDNAFQHRSLGYILRGKGEIKRAIKEYEKVVELKPDSKEDYKALADLYLRDGQEMKAISAYEKVVELDPKDKEAQDALAGLYKVMGMEDEAIARKEKILEQFPDDTETMMDLGKAYQRRGESEKAVRVLRRLLQKQPQNTIAMEYLGYAYQDLEQYRRAIAIYKKIIRFQPKNKKIFCNIADCYKSLKDYTTASRYVQKALAIDPNYGLAYITMAHIYEASADECIEKKGKTDFYDKLVYELAYKEYKKATKDPEWRDLATKEMSRLEPFLPTTEDRFFHKGETEPKGPCYRWIKER